MGTIIYVLPWRTTLARNGLPDRVGGLHPMARHASRTESTPFGEGWHVWGEAKYGGRGGLTEQHPSVPVGFPRTDVGAHALLTPLQIFSRGGTA